MTKPRPADAGTAEIYLNPGDFHFSGGKARLHTLLGSCVAITLWHPVSHVGGMCHFVLPGRSRREAGEPDGRYGDEAMALFLGAIARCNTRPGEYEAKLFGAGNMFSELAVGKSIGVAQRNAEAGVELLRRNGFRLVSDDLGGNGHRRVIFDLRDGNAWVRHEKPPRKCAA